MRPSPESGLEALEEWLNMATFHRKRPKIHVQGTSTQKTLLLEGTASIPCLLRSPFEVFFRGADGFGTGSGCRLITCRGPQMRESALDVAELLGDAAGAKRSGRSPSPASFKDRAEAMGVGPLPPTPGAAAREEPGPWATSAGSFQRC